MSSTQVFSFNRTYTATFAADAMRNVLRDIIRTLGLDPQHLINDWDVLGVAAKTWLESGHLLEVVLEFYDPGSNIARKRVDLPVAYDGSGVDDDMWIDRDHIRRSLAKISKLPSSCRYSVILRHSPGAADVAGMGAATKRSVAHLTSRSAGSVISTPDIVAGLRSWE